MKKVGFRLKNKDDFFRFLDGAMVEKKEATAVALYKVAGLIIEDAKSRSPVDTTMMRESGYAELPTYEGKQVKTEIGFGGPAGQYVLQQHEDMSLHHTTGEPKFLSNAINDYSSSFSHLMQQYFLEADASGAKLKEDPEIKTNPWQGPTFKAGEKT